MFVRPSFTMAQFTHSIRKNLPSCQNKVAFSSNWMQLKGVWTRNLNSISGSQLRKIKTMGNPMVLRKDLLSKKGCVVESKNTKVYLRIPEAELNNKEA